MSGPIAAALRELMALGVEGEALVSAIARIEASIHAPKERTTGAVRQERYRRNKASLNVTSDAPVTASQSVTNRNDVTKSDALHNSKKITSLTVLHPEKKKEASKSVRLAADWKPTADERSYAETQGLDEQEIDRAADDFRDFWHATPGAKGGKLDWSATWRRWVRTAADRKRERSARLARPALAGGNGSAPADFASIVARRRLAGQN